MSHHPARWFLRIAALLAVGHLAACAQQSDDPSLTQGSHQSQAAQSCENKCGGSSEDQSCYCDDECDTIGEFCSDYASACGNGAGGSGAGGAASGGSKATGGASSGGKSGSGGTSGSGGAASGKSCAGHCGSASADGSCWCDPLCQKGGDCCADAVSLCPMSGTGGTGGGGGVGGATSANSCVGHCGGPSAGGTCWCDPNCSQTGDCCADVASACGGTNPTGGCSPALCGSPNPGSEGGQPCYCDMDCMLYGDCCSNVTICGI